MHDLVGAYERLNTVYRKYIESAFPLRYSNMAEERRSLYAGSDTLSQIPLLEPTPVYPSANLTLAQAAVQLPEGYSDLPTVAQGLLGNPSIQLWKHQWDSVRTVLRDRKDLVVTTGTGSGKTECFLLPVLAELAKESTEWPASPPPPAERKWWGDDVSEWRSQWAHTERNVRGLHAVRAMVLYPLNSLVEDQIRRLRQTLDSDDVLRWFDTNRGGNRVTFGRYTGATPVSGSPGDESALRRLRERLRDSSAESAAVRADDDLPPEVRYYFPNVDGGEMWSRWDMQETPPDILITNYHMLNIMLMRQVEAGMFEKTRAWLKSNQANKFFLIVDELHSYRGTPGTEVAYILRLLLDRLARHHGYTGQRGYHPLLAIAAGTGEVLMSRLREGRANTARGAAHFLRETVGRVRHAGARGQLTVRADSGFYAHALVVVCREMDVRFSITIRQHARLRELIEAIPEEDWTPVPYWMDGGADVAETTYTPFQGEPEAAPVRLIVRRVKPTPGSQLALFASYSYHGFITDRDGETLELEADHRRHAEIENAIRDLKHGVGLNLGPLPRQRRMAGRPGAGP